MFCDLLIYTGRVLILMARFARKELVRASSLHIIHIGAHELDAITERLTLEDTSNSLQNCKGMFVLQIYCNTIHLNLVVFLMNIDKETLCLLVGCLDNLEHELLRLFHGSQHDPAFLQLSSCSTRESTIRNLTLGESCRRLAY